MAASGQHATAECGAELPGAAIAEEERKQEAQGLQRREGGKERKCKHSRRESRRTAGAVGLPKSPRRQGRDRGGEPACRPSPQRLTPLGRNKSANRLRRGYLDA